MFTLDQERQSFNIALARQQVATQQLVTFGFDRAVGDVGGSVEGGTKKRKEQMLRFSFPLRRVLPAPPLLLRSLCLHSLIITAGVCAARTPPTPGSARLFCCFPKVWGSVLSKSAGAVRHYKLPPAPLCALENKTTESMERIRVDIQCIRNTPLFSSLSSSAVLSPIRQNRKSLRPIISLILRNKVILYGDFQLHYRAKVSGLIPASWPFQQPLSHLGNFCFFI